MKNEAMKSHFAIRTIHINELSHHCLYLVKGTKETLIDTYVDILVAELSQKKMNHKLKGTKK
jgi:hypothetical protein